MDPEAPRTLGNLEESEPERRAPARSNLAKRTLEEFLLAFEEKLREHPDEAATSATAALEGRADGSWRTPIEGGERSSRRLPRRVVGRPAEDRSLPPSPANERPDPSAPPEQLPAAAGPGTGDRDAAAPTPITVEVLAGDALPAADSEPGPGASTDTPEVAAAAKRRNRHRRRHRHR